MSGAETETPARTDEMVIMRAIAMLRALAGGPVAEHKLLSASYDLEDLLHRMRRDAPRPLT